MPVDPQDEPDPVLLERWAKRMPVCERHVGCSGWPLTWSWLFVPVDGRKRG